MNSYYIEALSKNFRNNLFCLSIQNLKGHMDLSVICSQWKLAVIFFIIDRV